MSTPTPPATDPLADAAPRAPSRSRADTFVISVAMIAVWGLVVMGGRAWGILLETRGDRLVLYTPPILGGYREGRDLRFLIGVAVAVVLIAVLPVAATRLRWGWTLVVAAVTSLAWWVAVAVVDGGDALTRGLHWPDDYAPTHAAFSADPRQFLATFLGDLPGSSIQLRGHPPGVPLLLALLDRLHLGTEWWTAVVVLAVAASGVIAVLIAVREVAGEHTARLALPFLVLAPYAIWMAISFDALFAAVAAWMVALLVVATSRSGRTMYLAAIGAGLLAGVSALFSYGLVLMACIAVPVILARRAWRPAIIAAVSAAAVIAALVPFGFWWLTGLSATRSEYDRLDAGVSRRYGFFVFENLSAWFLTIGPATVVALAFLRDRRLWLLAGGALAAVVLADVSGLSKGEVERIWLPFTIWVLPAAAVLGGQRWLSRGWLAAQATATIGLNWFIKAHW